MAKKKAGRRGAQVKEVPRRKIGKHTQSKDVSDKVRKTRGSGKEQLPSKRDADLIDTEWKGLLQALQPPIDADKSHLDSVFRAKLDALLADLSAKGCPFKFVEGFRT